MKTVAIMLKLFVHFLQYVVHSPISCFLSQELILHMGRLWTYSQNHCCPFERNWRTLQESKEIFLRYAIIFFVI